jgi:hypothetical protein
MSRGPFLRLMVKLLVYYVVIGGTIIFLVSAYPKLMYYLPVGGVDEIASADISAGLGKTVDIARHGGEVLYTPSLRTDSRFDNARNLILAMIGTLLLMLPVSWVYRFIHQTGDHDHSLDETAFILPLVVSGIVLVVQHSLALAFSLAGIVAGVQFRRALKDTYDTLFILIAIGVGIAAGVKALDIAAVMSIFFNFATVMVCVFGDGLETHHKRAARLRKRERAAVRSAAVDNEK